MGGSRPIDRASVGLLGLIRLGNAWESVDVFGALAEALSSERKGTTAVAALERAMELQRTGKNSLTAFRFTDEFHPEGSALGFEKTQATEEYRRLRQEADKWHQERTDFMMARLKAGRHPDTDNEFWTGYTPRAVEVRDVPFYQRNNFMIWSALIGIPLILGIWLLVLLTKKLVRRRKAWTA